MSQQDAIKALTRSLAAKKLSQEQIETIANAIGKSKYPVRSVEIFPCGIKMNCDIDGPLGNFDLKDLTELWPWPVDKVEIFPVGIIKNDESRMSISFNL